MIIGIDFDNTIACHEDSFRNLALSKGFLPEGDENPKETLKRGFLRQNATNVLWTEAQAEVYGKRLSSAKVFDGFPSFLSKAVSLDHKVLVISHRTIYPALGGCMDLHDAAIAWLLENSLTSPKGILRENCFFETTLEEKVARIGIENCDLFIDDLASVLEHPGFPKHAKGISFGKKHDSLLHLPSWKDADWLFDLPVKSIEVSKPSPQTLPFELHEDSFRKILDIQPRQEIRLETMKGGGNNRSYKIFARDQVFMGKVFFREKNDPRNRLHHELSFTRYLEHLGSKCFPKMIASGKDQGIAAYEWLDGEPLDSDCEIATSLWEQCIEFLTSLQHARESEIAKRLPPASESAFSLREHWGVLQRRHDYWSKRIISEPDSIPGSIREFLSSKLEIEYQKLAKDVIGHPDFDSTLTAEERILSPSDFGLHNASLQRDGSLHFFDFEYAGWDDPAKTLADFFAQPRIKAPFNLFPAMRDRIMEFLPNRSIENFVNRLPLVIRIINIKWCYICLNVFHPADRRRREFADCPEVDLPSLNETLNKLVEDSAIAYPV